MQLVWPIALLCTVVCSTDSFPSPGEWPCYRGNPTLDGRSRIVGHITEPKVAWKQFVGVTDTFLKLEPGRGDSRFTVAPATLPAASPVLSDPAWGLTAPDPPSATTAYADVLPDVAGVEKLEFESGFNVPTVNGQWQPGVGRCFAMRDGQWTQVWQTEPIDMLFQPLPIVGDFDGNGQPEVAILPWYDLLVLDARTGKIKDRCRFTEARSYGFFGVYDLDRDGRSEFVVVADFCKHVDVLGYRGGKPALLWQENIETDITNPQKVLRAYPRPAADVDGDGELEVMVNLYNGSGDGRWHITVRDGMTGAVRADLVDETLQGIADVNADGVAELLTVRTSGAGVPSRGTILVRGLRGGEVKTLWQLRDAAWQTWDPPLPPNVNTAATFAQRDVLCRAGKSPARVVVRQTAANGEVTLRVATWGKSGFGLGPGLSGRNLDALALDDRGNMLARASSRPGTAPGLAITAGKVTALCASPRGGPPGQAVVAKQPGQTRPLIIVHGADEELVAFRPPLGDRPPEEVWRTSGRGQNSNWPSDPKGVVVADLRSDGGRQVLFATSAPSGCARLVAADLDLRTVWTHDFASIPGTPPVWNTGGIIYWQAAHFTDRRSMDVLVTIRRSMMHSEETALLSGRDGHEVWRRNREISSRGVGGIPFAVADYDGDGFDDAASFHPSIYYVLDGATGKDIIAMETTWPPVPAKPVYWGNPIAGDFERTGKTSTFYAGFRGSMTGLVRADGTLAWWDALDQSPSCYPAIGDFDGDGRLEAINGPYADGLRCYDAATGRVKWRMASPIDGTPSSTVSADINGDGRDEALLLYWNALCCVATAPSGDGGALLWRIDVPASAGPPCIADVAGDGTASILLQSFDGNVYCLH